MNRNLIMPGGNLENILSRLNAAHELFLLLHGCMGDDPGSEAMYGACDLLRSIIKDFQADVDSAEEVET